MPQVAIPGKLQAPGLPIRSVKKAKFDSFGMSREEHKLGTARMPTHPRTGKTVRRHFRFRRAAGPPLHILLSLAVAEAESNENGSLSAEVLDGARHRNFAAVPEPKHRSRVVLGLE